MSCQCYKVIAHLRNFDLEKHTFCILGFKQTLPNLAPVLHNTYNCPIIKMDTQCVFIFSMQIYLKRQFRNLSVSSAHEISKNSRMFSMVNWLNKIRRFKICYKEKKMKYRVSSINLSSWKTAKLCQKSRANYIKPKMYTKPKHQSKYSRRNQLRHLLL